MWGVSDVDVDDACVVCRAARPPGSLAIFWFNASVDHGVAFSVFSGETAAPSATRPGPPHTRRGAQAPPSSPETRPTAFLAPPAIARPTFGLLSSGPCNRFYCPFFTGTVKGVDLAR
jgi:hypothetical protein